MSPPDAYPFNNLLLCHSLATDMGKWSQTEYDRQLCAKVERLLSVLSLGAARPLLLTLSAKDRSAIHARIGPRTGDFAPS